MATVSSVTHGIGSHVVKSPADVEKLIASKRLADQMEQEIAEAVSLARSSYSCCTDLIIKLMDRPNMIPTVCLCKKVYCKSQSGGVSEVKPEREKRPVYIPDAMDRFLLGR